MTSNSATTWPALVCLMLACAACAPLEQQAQESAPQQPAARAAAAPARAAPMADRLERARALIAQGRTRSALDGPLADILHAFALTYRQDDVRYFSPRTLSEAQYDGWFADRHGMHAVIASWVWGAAWHLRGYALLESGQLQPARQALQRALELAPVNALYLAEMGYLEYTSGHFGKSLQLYEKAEKSAMQFSPLARRDSERALALRGQGQAMLKLGRTAQARERLQASLALAPDNADARRALESFDGPVLAAPPLDNGQSCLDPERPVYRINGS